MKIKTVIKQTKNKRYYKTSLHITAEQLLATVTLLCVPKLSQMGLGQEILWNPGYLTQHTFTCFFVK